MSSVTRRPGARGPLPGDHRQRLLDGLAACVRSSGFRASTVADVVRAAGASRNTFYAHFKDLDACYLALFEAFAEDNLRRFATAVIAGGTPRERLERAVGSYLDAVARDPSLLASFFTELHSTGEEGRRRLRVVNLRAGTAFHELSLAVQASQPGFAMRPISVLEGRVLTAGIVQVALMAQEEGTPLRAVHTTAVGLLERVLLAP